MKILFINQFFFPDAAATSQYLTDLARAVLPEDSATVICGAAEYAGDEAIPGDPPPVDIIRIRNYRFGARVRHRVASYVTFVAGAFVHALRTERPDVVVTLTTPPFISLAGTLLKALRGSRHVIWEMDVYPDIATGVGFLSRFSWFIRLTSVVANYIHRHADAIVVLGDCMRERLLSHGVPAHKIHIAENWADGDAIAPLPFPSHAQLILHYSGNLGLAHDVETIRGAIEDLQGDDRFRFIFAGGGRLRAPLQAFCAAQKIGSVEWAEYCPRAELGRHLAKGHIGLVTQNAGAAGSVVPSKVYGIMAAGRPVLFIGPKDSEVARMIQRFDCGWHVEPGDSDRLIGLLLRLANERSQIERRGARARAAFELHYDRPMGVERVARVIGMATVAETAQDVGEERGEAAYAD